MDEMIPLCTDCKHCEVNYATMMVPDPPDRAVATAMLHKRVPIYRCVAMSGWPNPINGESILNSDCGMMRLGCDCGREGKLFKSKGDKQ